MIRSLTVTNHRVKEPLNIVLGDLDTSGFLITNIEGLGPCKANINTTEMATGDGSIFNSSRLEPRNIVISITYDYRLPVDIETLRHKSYAYFPIKQKVKLIFETDERVCRIDGYVESNEPLIFSPREGTQISIICPDPYFKSYGDDGVTVTSFGSIESAFEFKCDKDTENGYFTNELDDPQIQFSIINTKYEGFVEYYGDSATGIKMTIQCYDDVGSIRISKRNTQELMTIDGSKVEKITGSRFKTGDIIVITTDRNNKKVRLFRNGEEINILNALDKNSTWFTLDRGLNDFTYSILDGSGWILFTIENDTLYEGV